MTPRETIDNMIATYPSIFKTSWDCAKQLLFTNGNGYSWKDGELIYEFKEFSKINNIYEAIDRYFERESSKEVDITDYCKALHKYKTDSFKENIKTIIRHFNYRGDGKYNINVDENTELYFSAHDAIFEIPDNVTKEWRDFCYNVLNSLLISNIDLGEFDQKLQDVYNHLVELKTKVITRTYEIEKLVIDSNNPKLHDKLDKLGFKPLSWTTSKNIPDLRLCIADGYYERIGNYVYWNDGSEISKFKDYRTVLICTDEDEFINYAKQMISGKQITKTVTKTIFE